MRFLRSSALSLAVGYIGLGLAALALFAAPLWFAWRATIEEGRIEILQEDAQRLADVFHREGPQGLVSYINTRVAMRIAYERYLLLADSNLKPLAGNLVMWPQSVPRRPGDYTITLPPLPEDRTSSNVAVAIVHQQLPGGYHLLVGRDTARYAPLERRFWYALASAVGILSILGSLGGLMVRRSMLARIHDIRQTVSAIIQGDLTQRLPTLHSGGDELNTLAQTLNGMLEQIEQLLHGARNVSNAIAHDLRTPLTELRARLEELCVSRLSTAESLQELEAAVADVDRVISIFNALLRLAEIDSGMRRSGFVALDLSEIAAAAVEFYLPAAELRGSSLVFASDGPAQLRGDPVLLAQALGNLIDNALKYTPENGTITVSVKHDAQQQIEVLVADTGPGIPEAERPKVIERFYRGDASRCTPGVGLGLSLVEAVAHLHGSHLQLEDNVPGLRARIVLAQDPSPIPRTPRTTLPEREYHGEPVYP
jgi:signal transduction histidine kinase